MAIKDWFNDVEDAKIRVLNGEGYNDANIADMIGAAFHRVNRYRKFVGLPKNDSFSEMSTGKKRQTMRQTMKERTGGLMNYRNVAHIHYARELGWSGYYLGEALILEVLREEEGMLEIPEVICRINMSKAERGWKPETTLRMFSHYASMLRSKGMVEMIYPRGENYKKESRFYCLTDLAYEKMELARIVS